MSETNDMKKSVHNHEDKTVPIFTTFDEKNNLFVFPCPNCKLYVEVERGAVACSIFRHLYYAVRDADGNVVELTGQVDSHAPQQICEQLLQTNRVVGCGKPFKMIAEVTDSNIPTYRVEACGYL